MQHQIEIPDNYFIITGHNASDFRDDFVSKVVAKQNPERASALANSDRFIIKIEQGSDGVFKYETALDTESESFIAVGPNFLKRLLKFSQDSLFD